ncbi:MAG TPA: helicase-associated domain-containing protein [Marmoricola sp.]|nr:helicase-associated domain-containing protein [Marmoricola sp.]
MPSTPRTLAEQLRGWSVDQLAALLEARPDLAVPAPADSAQLASRAVVRTSVLRALDALDTLQLTVLEAVVQLGPVDLSGVQAVLRAETSRVVAAVHLLRGRALVWGTDDALRAVSVVGDILAVPHGPAVGEVAGLVAELDRPAREILDHLDRTGADGVVGDARRQPSTAGARTPTEALLARRLLVARDDRQVTLPWSVRLALRGGRSTHQDVSGPPPVATGDRDQALVDRASAGAAFEFVRRTELLLDHWGTHPPGALRAGGLGVRDLRGAAAFVHAGEPEVALVLETAQSAGLLGTGMTDELDTAWLPTEAFDGWQGKAPAQRWLALARAWLGSKRLVSAIGGRDESGSGKPVNALAPGLERNWLPGLRRDLVGALGEIPPGTVLASGTGVSSLLEHLRWLRPRRPRAHLDVVPALLEEATSLGLVGRGGLSSFGRSLVADATAGRDDAAEVLAALLPAPVDHVLLQADLTAVAPGPLEQQLARKLTLLADVESRGGATVYRFAAGSVRRAFDAGWSAAEVHDFLASSSRTSVPQSLSYLVDDVARRFGTVRAGYAAAFLRSDDETALTALLHDPGAARLRLRRLAPTVLVSDVPLDTLLPRLRELGVAPVVEAADGTVRVARPDTFRARSPRTSAEPSRQDARSAARISAVVTAVRAGDRAAASRPPHATASTPADVVGLLRGAAESGSPVWIGYVDQHGATSERVVRPVRVEGGRLTAYDERSDDLRSFAVHRITAARTGRPAV